MTDTAMKGMIKVIDALAEDALSMDKALECLRELRLVSRLVALLRLMTNWFCLACFRAPWPTARRAPSTNT
jgi:hypothetical protein